MPHTAVIRSGRQTHITSFLGSRYAELMGLSYISLSYAIGWRVFRVVVLFDIVLNNPNNARP